MTTSTTPPTERVGRYQLLEPIGIGPSGAVSRAKVFGVAGFERQFAVKRFHAELTATAAMAAGLSAAARAYGSLEHPRIARMSEFGVAQGATFTAVEYVPGLDALRLIAEARLAGASGAGLAAGGALALVSQAARAVGYAHGRGLTHLGLAPTNVIVTADGDIKITDFGILSATLPQRPIEVARLAQRIPYLAPEQLANEATSAATDVFALGVLAYELVTGTRTFRGDTPQQVASAIMAGPPAEPPLPRPIVRVLQRCLARSPFERFPDARALADALDAALRVAPVPGTRKDIGAQVKDTLDRLAALNEGQMSGMVALHLGTGPIRRLDDERLPGEPPHAPDLASAPYELAAPDPMAGGPAALAAAASTMSDLPRPMTTVPGLPPPPIPVPPGLGPPSIPPPPGLGNNTLLGMGNRTPPALPVVTRPGAATPMPPLPVVARRPLDPAPPLTVESAVHPLDPSDLMAVDPLTDDADDVGGELADATVRAPHGDGATEADAPALPAEASADDFGDAPTHSLASRDAAARLAGGFRRDRSGDARPTARDGLEPGLFDPIVRADAEPRERRPSTLDEDRWFDEPSASRAPAPDDADASASGSGRSAVPSPAPPTPSGRVMSPMPASASGRVASSPVGAPGSGRASSASSGDPAEPKLGQTMLGYAAPSSARATPPSPFPPAASLPPERSPEDELPVPALPPERNPHGEPGADQLSELMLEGFRTGPAPAALEIQPGWQETSGIVPAPTDPGLPPPAPAHGWVNPPIPSGPPIAVQVPGAPRHRALWILAGMIGAAVVAIGAWQLYVRLVSPPMSAAGITSRPDRRLAAKAPADAAEADAAQIAAVSPPGPGPGSATPAAPRDAGVPPLDAARVAVAIPGPGSGSATPTAPRDAGSAPPDAARVAAAGPPDAATAPRDAGAAPDARVAAVAAPGPAAGPGDSLAIASTPPGARVFLDGADAGTTPLRLPGSPDRHTVALLLAGHELYVAQVDGHGTFQIPLKEVTPSNGPAGIKVLRCKDKDRYYVFLDGKPTGQTCPSERIGCELGPHTVEVYDVVSETRRKWDVVVKETRLSYRVRVE